ncbi:UbiA prenyltransferase family protein [Methanothrix harundinacea]|uniref:Prenyltransferase, UbiA family n=1 Tax=Methanothrix harundinacea (strain 6Ac) TaxID=1110509 RepID=G7WP18_METH6|nr:UbiA family prenyltransferase [Methanothrix harundinacea]AET64859.1 Prenyltransferase, UbiA family [Methanothrix harundinacea 6Ac]
MSGGEEGRGDKTTAGGKLRAYAELLRPPLAPMDIALPGAAALLAAYATAGALPAALPFAIATLGAYAAITSSYVYNDCCDVDVDAVGMPDRPLPSSQVTRSAALAYSALLFGIAAAVAFYLNPESLVALIGATMIMAVYSKAAKRTTPFSWALVGLSFGIVPVGVWLAMAPAGILKDGPGLHAGALLLGAMICITDWGFTNCDASRDVEGDRREGIPTFPVTYGIPLTAKLVAAAWVVGVLLSIALGVATGLGPIYFAAALVAGGWMIAQTVGFVKTPTAARGERTFYQGANYRAVLFAALIVDVLLRATVAGYPGLLG